MRARGRPPATRNVFAFDSAPSPLPNEVLLDTSYVVEALITTQPQHRSAVDFLVRLAEDDVAPRFSEMLELELAETAFQLALKERHKRDWKRSRHDGRVRPRAARLMSGVADAWQEVLSYFDYTRVTIHDVVAEVPRLMSTSGLRPTTQYTPRPRSQTLPWPSSQGMWDLRRFRERTSC